MSSSAGAANASDVPVLTDGDAGVIDDSATVRAYDRLPEMVLAGIDLTCIDWSVEITEGELAALAAAHVVVAKVCGTKRASDAPAEGAPAAKKQALMGTFTLPDGLTYAGEYFIRDGMQVPHGNGASYVDGSLEYTGSWFEGLFHGHGETVFYKGDWAMGNREGQGEEYNGFWSYTGSWKDDEPHGVGNMYDSNDNTTYAGEWVNGSAHDQGKFFCRDGEWDLTCGRKMVKYMVYDAAWEHGKRSGRGKLFLRGGALEGARWHLVDDVFAPAVEPVPAAPAVDDAAAPAPVVEDASAPAVAGVR